MSNDRPTPPPYAAGTLFFKPAAVSVLAAGMFLHATRIIAGETTLANILTPTVDGFFGLAMASAALAGWWSWGKVQHRRKAHKVVHGAILVYLSISVPVHVRSFFTDDVGDLTGVFPAWYSGVFLLVATAMLVHVWRLRFVAPVDVPAAQPEGSPYRASIT